MTPCSTCLYCYVERTNNSKDCNVELVAKFNEKEKFSLLVLIRINRYIINMTSNKSKVKKSVGIER